MVFNISWLYIHETWPRSSDQIATFVLVRRFQGSSGQQADTGAHFLRLSSVIEKSDVKEDGIDTGCVLHYKVNPYVNSHTDGPTCWVAGMRFSAGGRS